MPDQHLATHLTTHLTTITRKARIRPEFPKEKIHLPTPPSAFNATNPMMLVTLLCSMAGMSFYVFLFSRMGSNNFFIYGVLVMSSCMLIGALLNFLAQWLPARKRKRRIIRNYRQKVTEVKVQLQKATLQERQGRIELDPPLILSSTLPPQVYEQLRITPIVERRCDNLDLDLWSRRPDDPDFLSIRVGMGPQSPGFSLVHHSNIQAMGNQPREVLRLADEVEELANRSTSLITPVKIKLDAWSTTAIIGTGEQLKQARQTAMAILAYLAYHHSPEDVRVIILAPESQGHLWEWTAQLPHTLLYDPKWSSEESAESTLGHAVAIGNEAVLNLLPLISRELSRREILLGDLHPTMQSKARPMLPRLVIVIDHFDEHEDLDYPTQFLPAARIPVRQGATGTLKRPRLLTSPLQRAELALALNGEPPLGVSVLAICGHREALPSATGQIIDLDPCQSEGQFEDTISMSQTHQARIRGLEPDAEPAQLCPWLDEAPHEFLRYLGTRLQPLRPITTKRLELRTQVDICTLFEPPIDLISYDPYLYWKDMALRDAEQAPLMRIPIGLKIGDEVQYLDLLKDGPHGILIGQTGSGKSELLQAIIAALAISYKPGEVNFLLIDYKAGLALEPFSKLPHTVGFLSNVSSPALIQRFITMLRAEATRREIRLKEGKATPRLVIIIDEFAEMAKRTESVLDELFTITRVGREIGMHLLLASQRPEGIIGSKVRDYVQYRLCLRCASPEDSREVLRRVDAASLPASIPGRGYLLHGDNQLDLFQAARVTLPVAPHIQNLFNLSRQQDRKNDI